MSVSVRPAAVIQKVTPHNWKTTTKHMAGASSFKHALKRIQCVNITVALFWLWIQTGHD